MKSDGSYAQDWDTPYDKVNGHPRGADLDITVFDPKTVRQNATPANGGLPSTGIPYVVVNGTIVVKDSQVLKGVYPGRPIRQPVQR